MTREVFIAHADGVSRIDHIEQIDRGYTRIEERLNAIGARITRID